MSDAIVIRTFGTFSVIYNGRELCRASSRSQKPWKILMHIISYGKRVVTIESLIDSLWPDDQPDSPEKTLYTHMSRLRALMPQECPPVVLTRHNGYQLNPEANIELDTVDFEELLLKAQDAQTDDERIPLLQKAVDIYTGEYLSEYADEQWALPIVNYYKRMYLKAVNDLIGIYSYMSAQDEIIMLCNRAIQNEPLDEGLYEHLIQSLLLKGDNAEAKRQYRRISDALKKEYGVQPSAELAALSKQMRGEKLRDLADINGVMRSLDWEEERKGALFCTTDMFKQIYNLDKKLDDRAKLTFYLGIVSIMAPDGKKLSPASLRPAMRVLRQCLVRTLRQGDVVSLYSQSQYLLLLLAPTREDAEKALVRVRRVFAMDAGTDAYKIETELSKVGGA